MPLLSKKGIEFSNHDDLGSSSKPNLKDARFNLRKEQIIILGLIREK